MATPESTSLLSAYTTLSLTLPPPSSTQLTPKETHLLNLISHDADLSLTLLVLSAYSTTPLQPTPPTPADLTLAQSALQTATARHALKSRIVTRALTSLPIATATHAPVNADARLSKAIPARDALNLLAGQATRLEGEARQRLLDAERVSRVGLRTNERSAERMMGMARSVAQTTGDFGERASEGLRGAIEEAEKEERKVRGEWRVVKGLAGGIVLGSGVDWVGEERLVGMVMDDEDDEGEGDVGEV